MKQMTQEEIAKLFEGAPEGATHYFAPFFYRADETRAYVFETTWSPSAYTSRQIGEIGVKKPDAAQTWSGDGLPPVGTICEYRVGQGPWFTCTVKYVTSPPPGEPAEVVIYCKHLKGDQIGVSGPDEGQVSFRPIKTPAQIAADEREADIKRMVSILHEEKGSSTGPVEQGFCMALYDAGLRFPKVEQGK